MRREKREAATTARARGRPRLGRGSRLGRNRHAAPTPRAHHVPAAEGGGAPCPVPTSTGVRVSSMPLFSVARVGDGARSRRQAAPRSSAMCAAQWSAPARGSLGGARDIRMATTRRHDVRRVCGACCKIVSHVFQMSHKNVVRVSCGCCKS
jgi:hypothetical protein